MSFFRCEFAKPVPLTHGRCRGVTCQWRLYISITSLRSASRLAGRV